METDRSTGPEKTESLLATIRHASTTGSPPPTDQSSKTDDELVLTWVEERLIGVWEECTHCEGGHYRCETCHGMGESPREDYLRAELALTDELFIRLGVELMVTSRASVNRAIYIADLLPDDP
jgi:hypothetical protein